MSYRQIEDVCVSIGLDIIANSFSCIFHSFDSTTINLQVQIGNRLFLMLPENSATLSEDIEVHLYPSPEKAIKTLQHSFGFVAAQSFKQSFNNFYEHGAFTLPKTPNQALDVYSSILGICSVRDLGLLP